MFGFSAEHLIVLAIVLLIFGPRKLPEMGQTLGRAMKNFRDGLAGVENATFQKVEQTSSEKLQSPQSAKTPTSEDGGSA